MESALGSIAAAFSTALNQKMQVRMGEINPLDTEELRADFPDEIVIAAATFTGGMSDGIAFLLMPNLAAKWADLMLAGEGKAEFSAEEHLDAVTELLNQIGSVLSQHLSKAAESPIHLGPFETVLETTSNYADKWESFFRTDLTLEGKGLEKGKLTLLLAPQTVEDLADLSVAGGAEFGDRPPPAVLEDELDRRISARADLAPDVRSAHFEDLGPAESGGSTSPQKIEALMDLELPVIIELGRTSMFIKDILELSPGSIVELNKLSGEPVDLYINDKKFAHGEVVVIDENFGIRITDLVKVEDRIRTLK